MTGKGNKFPPTKRRIRISNVLNGVSDHEVAGSLRWLLFLSTFFALERKKNLARERQKRWKCKKRKARIDDSSDNESSGTPSDPDMPVGTW